jgi:anti-sigma B factor antagonist
VPPLIEMILLKNKAGIGFFQPDDDGEPASPTLDELPIGGSTMEITTHSYKHCDLLKLKGRIDSATAPQLEQAIQALTDQSRFRLILDMQGLDFMSSAGLRVLVNTQKMCKRYNRGELVLVDVPANIKSALELSGFTPLFKFFNDSLSAVGYF